MVVRRQRESGGAGSSPASYEQKEGRYRLAIYTHRGSCLVYKTKVLSLQKVCSEIIIENG